METTILSGNYQVQRAGLRGEWKTICSSSSIVYAEDIFQRQVKYSSVGKFRLLDPSGKVVKYKEVSLFN